MSARSQERQARLDQWQAMIRECRQSGETIKGWCEREGIAVATYYYWERRCRRGWTDRKTDIPDTDWYKEF